MLIVKNALIHDSVRPEPYRGDAAAENGKLVSVGPEIAPSPGDETVDAGGANLWAGFVEAHGHTGLDGYGVGSEGRDYNEMNDILSPQLRAIDAFQPMDPAVRAAAEAGVTTLCVGPGSANVLGGTFTVVKPVGRRVDDMCVIRENAMKCAFGENPKRVYRDKCDSTRMSTAARLREALFRAREYAARLAAAEEDPSRRPPFDMKLNALLPVIRGEMPLKAHAHQADDLFTAIRIAREFGVKLTLEHCTEGHLIAEELAAEGVPVAVGPTLSHAAKFELRNKSWITPGVLQRAGCSVSIITDAPVIPQTALPLCAGMAIQAGMDEFEALKAVTIHPARHIGAEARVGSLEPGKDADLVLTDGPFWEIGTRVLGVWIDGRRVERGAV